MSDQNNQNPFGDNNIETNPIGTAGNSLAAFLSGIGAQLQKSYPATTNSDGTNIGGVNVASGNPAPKPPPQQSPNEALNQIFPNLQQGANPATGLTDKHAQVLQKLIDASIKNHAQNFINQVGPDTAQKLVDAHTATSPTANKMNGVQPTTNQASSTTPPAQTAPSVPSNPVNSSISNFLNTNNTSPQTVPVSQPAGPSSQKTGNFEYDKPQNLFEQIVGRPQVYQDSTGVVHYKPGGLFGSSANQEGLDQAKALLGLSSKEPLQPKDLVDLGAKKAAMAFDLNNNSNDAAKSYRTEYQKLSDDSGWTDTVKSTQLAAGIPLNTTNPLKQQQLVEAATGTKLGDLLKDPNAMQGLKGSLGNQAQGILNKLSQGKSALTPQQMARLKDVVNQQYQTKKVQFALATKGMADQISSDNKRRINGVQIDPKDVLRPLDVVNSQKSTSSYNVPDGRIVVTSPDGKTGHIPQNQLDEALKAGYKQVQ